MSNTFKPSRRNFIKAASVGTIAAIGIPQIVTAALATEKQTPKLTFNNGDVVLFQGDSITDWGRIRKQDIPNSSQCLGSGYTLITASKLLLDHPDKDLKIHNKGISGNKIPQLADRWDTDCLVLNPNVLSILIGANDFMGTRSKGNIGTYPDDYKRLLDITKKALPNVKLIIGEPFALKGVRAVNDSWYPAFDQLRKAARDIAAQYNAVFVPYQAAFDRAVQSAPARYWSLDGVHPSVAGEALMAQTWIKAVGA